MKTAFVSLYLLSSLSVFAEGPIWEFRDSVLPQGWRATGQAFAAQPICGKPVKTDRVRLPDGRKLARLGGDYWITPVDIGYSGCRIDSGTRTVNGGTLTSSIFAIDSPFLDLLIGGGGSPTTSVALVLTQAQRVRVPQTVFTDHGPGLLRMHRVRWNVAPYKGRSGFLVITDGSTEPSIATRPQRDAAILESQTCLMTANSTIADPVSLARAFKTCQDTLSQKLEPLDVVPPGTGIPSIMVADVRLSSAAAPDPDPPVPPAAVWGFADLHAHLFNHLGFGGRIIYGDISGDIEKALADCGAHATRLQFDMDVLPAVKPNGVTIFHDSRGWPTFEGWPKSGTLSHQQAYIDWLKRAWEGGLRLVLVDAGNQEFVTRSFQTLNTVIPGFDNTQCIAGPTDACGVDTEMKAAVDFATDKENAKWVGIAKTPAEARSLIGQGKLAMVLGAEVENLGNYAAADCKSSKQPSCQGLGSDPQAVRATLRDTLLHHLQDELGMSHLIPIHLTENAFGSPAMYNKLFEVSSWWTTGRLPRLHNGFRDSGIRYRMDLDTAGEALMSLIAATAMQGFPVISPSDPARYLTGEVATGLGHMSPDGLTMQGRILIQEMMKRGMVVDAVHMSDHSTEDTFDIAHRVDYPIIVSHTGFRETAFGSDVNDTSFGDGNAADGKNIYAKYQTANLRLVASERLNTAEQLDSVRTSGGVLGVGIGPSVVPYAFGQRSYQCDGNSKTCIPQDCDGTAKAFVQSYRYALQHMGRRGIALGSDINGMNGLAGARFGMDACAVGSDNIRAANVTAFAHAQAGGVVYATPIVDPHFFRFHQTGAFSSDERSVWEAIAIFKAGVNVDTWDPRLPQGMTRSSDEGNRIKDIVHGLQNARDHRPVTGDFQTAAWLAYTEGPWVDQSGAKVSDKLYVQTIWGRWNAMEGKNQTVRPPMLRNVSGSRDFDINLDGIAHYGLVPDFLQDVKNVGLSEDELAPLFRGAEEYIEMWEKAVARAAEARRVFGQ